jgi:hypothetical protein
MNKNVCRNKKRLNVNAWRKRMSMAAMRWFRHPVRTPASRHGTSCSPKISASQPRDWLRSAAEPHPGNEGCAWQNQAPKAQQAISVRMLNFWEIVTSSSYLIDFMIAGIWSVHL